MIPNLNPNIELKYQKLSYSGLLNSLNADPVRQGDLIIKLHKPKVYDIKEVQEKRKFRLVDNNKKQNEIDNLLLESTNSGAGSIKSTGFLSLD